MLPLDARNVADEVMEDEKCKARNDRLHRYPGYAAQSICNKRKSGFLIIHVGGVRWDSARLAFLAGFDRRVL